MEINTIGISWMTVVFAVLGASCFGVIIVLRLLYKRRRALQLLSEDGGPVVAFVGAKESGKTHYFAAMSYRMAIGAGPGLSVVPTDSRIRAHLSEVYDSLIDPKADKLSGTVQDPGELGAWSFALRAKVGQNFQLLGEFRTSDYPGEINQEPDLLTSSAGRVRDWFENLRAAEVLFGILDGAQLHRLMDPTLRDPHEEFQFRRWLTQLLPALAENAHTVHLIVLKWDALASAGISMTQLRQYLSKNHPDFSQFTKARPSLRIIPVSSVGSEFYEAPDFSERRHDFNLHPLNVEIPIALAFTEVIRHRLGGRPTPIPGRQTPEHSPSRLAHILQSLSLSFNLNLGIVGLQYEIKSDRPQNQRRYAHLHLDPDSYATIDQAYIAAYYHFESLVGAFDRTQGQFRANR